MKLLNIHIENFKSISNMDIELGRLNVFIGENGSGKSSILEALGIISATMEDRLEDRLLEKKGVRLGTPYLYKSSFKNEKTPPLMNFSVLWSDIANHYYNYSFSIGAPIDEPEKSWKIFSECLKNEDTQKKVFGRSNRSKKFDNYDGIQIPKDRSMYGLLRGAMTETLTSSDICWDEMDIVNQLQTYAIFSPNTLMLRGVVEDKQTRIPVGLYGGRLPDATKELVSYIISLHDNENMLLCNRLLFLCNWYKAIRWGGRNQNILSNNVTSPRRVLRFVDKYMSEDRNVITAYDANEGALYTLFQACLLFHKEAPFIFAIDNFDYGLNPRVAKEAAQIFCEKIIGSERTVLLTTHNPLVLDGLDLNNDEVRLFVVERNRKGKTIISRVQCKNDDIDASRKSISSLWLSGRLGGMPNL